ncbi:hypothetical protein P43SY_000625 [Pythium insidiosum]|uniref:Uncharacterized protein n=1 Tax=Pythium insidiosum TaxID=114742 RepID=A0AAD5Q216_PYTIN|nr:hypothetical protein P43SY_000625 [Pythium insidiosum]
MLLADSDGNQYELFVVFKAGHSMIPDVQVENDRLSHGFGRGLWEEANDIQRAYRIQVYGNPTPVDVAWMKPLKDCLRRKWVEHL